MKLVLLENPGHGGTLNHLGVEVASSDTVHDESQRLAGVGLLTDKEIDTTCCFATQDKVWVSGPDGKKTWFNATWLGFTGRALADELGDGWQLGLDPDDGERLRGRWAI